MKGQIYIDYMGGALLFFISIIFIVTSALGTVPEFSQGIEQNQLELTAWSVSTHLVERSGFWRSGSDSGTDWHRHMDGFLDENISIGLASEQGLDRAKVNTLLEEPYLKIKRIIGVEKDFNMEVREFAFVDTHKSFTKPSGSPVEDYLGVPSSQFKPPSTDSYDSSDSEVHYGSISIKSDEKRFLAVSHDGTYDEAYYSDNWNFSNSEGLGLGDSRIIEFDDRSYRFNGRDSGIVASDGKTIGLSRIMGRLGRRPSEQSDNVIEVDRFSNIGENPVKIEMQFWS